MEATLKINLIPHQIYILLHISIQHLSIWSQCLIHNKHQTRIAFTSPFKSTDERNGRRIRIGPESRRSRSDRNQNPLKIRIQILLNSGTNLVLLFARVLDTHPVLAHILMWVCGSAAWTRSGQGGARGSGGRVLAEDDTVQHTAAHTCGQMYIMYACYSRCVLFALMRTIITWRLMKESRLQEEFPWKQRCSTDIRVRNGVSLYCILNTVMPHDPITGIIIVN